MDQQSELQFDDRPVWHRALNETPSAYRAFAAYRDQGPRRTLLGAYRAIRRTQPAAEEDQLALDRAAEEWRTPSAWNRWRQSYQWEERAAAYDRNQDELADKALADLRKQRMEEQLAYDAEVRLPLIAQLDKKITELSIQPLAKTVQPAPEGKGETIYDRVGAFEALVTERRKLVREYYGAPLVDLARAAGAGREGEAAVVPLIGRFEYVPDGDVPPEPPPAATEAPPKDPDPA